MGFSSGHRGRRNGIGARAAALAASALLLALVAIAAVAFSSSPRHRATAVAAPPLAATDTVTIAEAVDRACFKRELDGAAGAASVAVPGPDLEGAAFGTVDARLTGPSGADWDLTIFDRSGEVIAASTSSGASELASGYVTEPGGLTVQVCRVSGVGTVAQLSVETAAVVPAEVEKASLALVETPRRLDKETLQSLDLDLTEHGDEDHIAVVLYGSDDKAALDRAGLDYEVQVSNLARQSAQQRAADKDFAAQTTRSSLPSGRDSYRRLFNYTQELKDLAKDNPEITRPITLPNETWEGRPVEGIEITTDPDNRRDGKPVFLQMGVHHAREWPSAEHAMEWAYELIKGYKAGDDRVQRLVRNTRTIVIPVVNPDGFNASREAGQNQGAANGRGGDDIANFAMSPNEYRRKNCRFLDDSEGGSCAQPSVGIASPGVDPNRNYGGFWAGPGASGQQTNETYYGPGPFSEPETQNIRELVSSRQVTTLITNHSFSNLILRPPGLASEPVSIDEPLFKAFSDAMAAQNGYLSIAGYELYDTSGTTEDWSYNATGGLGFTFEIGCNRADPENPDPQNNDCIGNFHPPFEEVVAQYEGTSPEAEAIGGKGNREAYFIAQESTADTSRHSLLEGNAPAGAILKVEKTFQTPTRAEDPESVEDHLETEMKVPDSGKFEFHINPSTRPLVALDRGRPAQGTPSEAPPEQTGTNVGLIPCADFENPPPTCYRDHPFTVPGGAGVDNESATVDLSWSNPANDWDLKVFRDGDGDGVVTADDEVGSSGNSPPATNESATFVRPETADGRLEPGSYIARVIDWATVTPDPYTVSVTFEGPEEFIPARTETWKFTCTFAGETRVTQDILIARGERQSPDVSLCATGGTPGSDGGAPTGVPSCQGRTATLVGSKNADAIIGTKAADVIVGLGGNDKLRGRGGNDVICAKGGRDNVGSGAGNDRVSLGGGNDRSNGAKGNDRIKGGVGKDRIAGGKGNDRLRGGGGKDRLRGGKGRDRLWGGGGADRCNGGAGRDRETGC